MPAMTPLLIRLKPGLKKSTASYLSSGVERQRKALGAEHSANPNTTPHQVVVCVELRRSKLHGYVISALSVLSLLTCLVSQLPWLYIAFATLWIMGSVLHWYGKPQHLSHIIDGRDGWILRDRHGQTPVKYQHANYRTQHLLVMTFITSSGKRKRVFVWRDAVTPAAFSWLSARMTLSEADAPVQNVATSGSTDVFSFSSRLDL